MTLAQTAAFTLRRGPAPPVALVTAPNADCGREHAQVQEWCRRLGLDLEVVRVGEDGDAAGPWQLVIALGGDGTILRALRLAGRSDTPVLGINLGHVGFLADAQPESLADALASVAGGRARIERHCALRVRVHDGPALDDRAYNDVVLGRHAGQGAAHIRVEADGTYLVDVVGDGVIVATTLGSTAYTVSAGGPAISPLLDTMVVTPVAAHTGPLRSLVLAAEEELRLVATDRSAPLTVEVDGRTTSEVPPGAAVTIRRAPAPAQLLRTTRDTFFEHLRDRLVSR